jgi:hypothetical protein
MIFEIGKMEVSPKGTISNDIGDIAKS